MQTLLPDVAGVQCQPFPFLPSLGHPDEATALLADPDDALTPAAMAEGIEAWDTDRAIQTADEHHLAELRQVMRDAREQVGCSAYVTVSRDLTINADGESSEWSAMAYLSGPSAHGIGTTPAAALASMLADLDQRTGIVPAFGGYRIPGVVLVTAGHDRTAAEALAHVRRVAIDPSYLDVLVGFKVVGVVDERPTRPASAAVAA